VAAQKTQAAFQGSGFGDWNQSFGVQISTQSLRADLKILFLRTLEFAIEKPRLGGAAFGTDRDRRFMA